MKSEIENESTTNREPSQIIEELIADKNAKGIYQCFSQLPHAQIARAISNLSSKGRSELIQLLPAREIAEILEGLPDLQVANLVEDIPGEKAAKIIASLDSDDQVDIIAKMSESSGKNLLKNLSPFGAENIKKLLKHKRNTVGSAMKTEFFTFSKNLTINELTEEIQNNSEVYSNYEISYIYLTDENSCLVGVVPIRALLFKKPNSKLEDVMIRNPTTLKAGSSLLKARGLFETNSFIGLPVVDRRQKIIGVLTKTSVTEEIGNQARRTFMSASGILGGEELRSLPIRIRSPRRLSILSINILLNIAAASVITLFQDTIAAVVILAVFLPIISDLSGCSGNQSVAVSIRELTLGVIRPLDYWKVLFNEMKMGIINGIALGLLLGVVAYLWKGNIYLSFVVGSALALNTLVAVSVGGVIPLILRKFKQDPALASAPILTTITDFLGFFLVLGLATMFLSKLTIS